MFVYWYFIESQNKLANVQLYVIVRVYNLNDSVWIICYKNTDDAISLKTVLRCNIDISMNYIAVSLASKSPWWVFDVGD